MEPLTIAAVSLRHIALVERYQPAQQAVYRPPVVDDSVRLP